MQRLDALFMSLVLLIGVLITVGLISQKWNSSWTLGGVASSCFWLLMCLFVFVPMALLHGASAFYPNLLSRYKSASGHHPGFAEFKAKELQWIYGALGHLVCAGMIALGVYWVWVRAVF